MDGSRRGSPPSIISDPPEEENSVAGRTKGTTRASLNADLFAAQHRGKSTGHATERPLTFIASGNHEVYFNYDSCSSTVICFVSRRIFFNGVGATRRFCYCNLEFGLTRCSLRAVCSLISRANFIGKRSITRVLSFSPPRKVMKTFPGFVRFSFSRLHMAEVCDCPVDEK